MKTTFFLITLVLSLSSVSIAAPPPDPATEKSLQELKDSFPGYLEFDPVLDRDLLGAAQQLTGVSATQYITLWRNGRDAHTIESYYSFFVKTMTPSIGANFPSFFKNRNEDYKLPLPKSNDTNRDIRIMVTLNAAWEIGPMRRWLERAKAWAKAHPAKP